jgi:hypothetical protein
LRGVRLYHHECRRFRGRWCGPGGVEASAQFIALALGGQARGLGRMRQNSDDRLARTLSLW